MTSAIFDKILSQWTEHPMDLHTATSIGCEDSVREILENCITGSIERKNSSGWTPLMYAACCTNLKVLLILLDEGPVIDCRNNSGQTALLLASKCGSTDAVNILVNAGADINIVDAVGWTALFYACAYGHRSVVQLLLEKGSNPNIQDSDSGITPLMSSATAGHEIIVKNLLHFGAVPICVSKSGQTAMDLAKHNGHTKVVALLSASQTAKNNAIPPSQKIKNAVESQDLKTLLDCLDLSKYYSIFESRGINLNSFYSLSDDDLKKLGVCFLGPRKKMCVAIDKWRQQNLANVKAVPVSSSSRLASENVRLQKRVEEVEQLLIHEKEFRRSEQNEFKDLTKNLKLVTEIYQRELQTNIQMQEKLLRDIDSLLKLIAASWKDQSPFNYDVIIPMVFALKKLAVATHTRSVTCYQRSSLT